MPAIDDFKGFTSGLGAPIIDAVAVTPSDSEDLLRVTRALYVGTAGNARVTLAHGTVIDFSGLVVGWHPIRVSKVHATGTTAANIIGCW
jgi:hypothetical protein